MKKTLKRLSSLALALTILFAGSASLKTNEPTVKADCPYTYSYQYQWLTAHLVKITETIRNGRGDIVGSYSYTEYR